MKYFFRTYMPPGGIITHVTISNMFWYSVGSRLSVILFHIAVELCTRYDPFFPLLFFLLYYSDTFGGFIAMGICSNLSRK